MDFTELERLRHGARASATDRPDAILSAYYNRSNECNNFFDEAAVEEGAEEGASPLYEDGGDLSVAEQLEESFEVYTI